MPQLTRLRFINVGHDNARMKDLIINLSDEQNHPLDSALWLRNGGGKSSLLSLFFSLINPKKSDFLGSKTIGGERSLGDYVQSGDHSIIVAEWRLDTAPDDAPIWYLTGGFYESRNETIERLFFAARVHPPELTFEKLPFRNEEGRRVPKNIFKQTWQNLGVKYPQAEVRETEILHEWRQILESERIDPELFNYQIRMNSHEGGADELFRFKNVDHFVDFFINVAMPPDTSNQISGNLEKFRGLLRRRKDQLIPGLELIEKLKPQMQAMIGVAEKQLSHRKETGELRTDLEQLRETITKRLAALTQRETQISELRRIAAKALQEAVHKTEIEETRMLSFQRIHLEHRAERFIVNQKALTNQLAQAEQQHLLWQAAIPLAEIERYEEKIYGLQKLLQSQSEELKPDWEAVKTAARDYAAALLWRMNKNRQQALDKIEEAKIHKTKAAEARHAAKDDRDEAIRAKTKAEQKAEQIKQAQTSRANLEKAKTIEPDELLETATLRWRQKLSDLDSAESRLKTELQITEERAAHIENDVSIVNRQQLRLNHELQILRQMIEQATDKQNELLDNAVLNKILEDLDAAVLNFVSLARVKGVRDESEMQLRELKSEIAEDEIVFEYLRANSLLPPLRDVRTILQILRSEGITAWAGWEHASEHLKKEEARIFIAEHPEIVQGVLVRDEHFQKARILIEQADAHLSSAVTVGTKSLALNGNASLFNEKRFVVGPTSDAHYDKNAAKTEQIILESRLQEKRRQSEEIKQWLDDLRDAAESLNQFISHYPPEWFAQRQVELGDAKENLEKCENQIDKLEQEKNDNQAQRKTFKDKLKYFSAEKRTIEKHINQLETHRNFYGTDEDLINLEKEKNGNERQAKNLLKVSAEKEKIADDEETQTRKLNEEARKLNADADRDERDSRSVRYVEKDVMPKAANVGGLKEKHQILCDVIDKKSDGNRLQSELNQTQISLHEMREKFSEDFGERISESEVRRTLSAVADKTILKSKSQEAFNEVNKFNKFLGAAESEMQGSQAQLNQHLNQHPQLKYSIAEDERNLTEPELEQMAEAAKSAMEEARSKKNLCEREISRLKDEDSQLQLQKQRFETQQKQIDDFLDEGDLFQNSVKAESPLSETDLTESQIAERLEKMKKQISLTRQRQTQIHAERQKIHRRFSTEIGELNFDFAKELRVRDEENLEREAASLLFELETREKNMREELEDCDKHRNLLVIELLNVADKGVQTLQSLASDSKLPDSAGTLARRKFLKINLKKLELPEQQQRIANLLDDIIAEGKTPNGIALLQRAVRKLSQPITVQVLFPNIDAPPYYIDIIKMSKESGGERLTSAVLLYCTLAKQRARERGMKISISGSLLLDNPVGTANRRQFLELQRETARAMNIQLIYTTGVKDYEAIGTLPNIVQLRNERRNDKNQSLLEAVRVVRPEEGTSSK